MGEEMKTIKLSKEELEKVSGGQACDTSAADDYESVPLQEEERSRGRKVFDPDHRR